MHKSKLLRVLLLLSLVLSLFVGCRAQNGNVSNNEGTEPSGNVTEPSNEVTEPSSDATEPSEDVTGSMELPLTVEYFKAHLTPYMTYGEAKTKFGPYELRNTNDNYVSAVWFIEDNLLVSVTFYPTLNENAGEYFATIPTNPDGTCEDIYLFTWYYHMPAYRAILYKDKISPDNIVEVWFDYGYGPFQQGE